MSIFGASMTAQHVETIRYIKPNILALAVLFSIHFTQLGIMPGSTTVRPLTPFFALAFFGVLLLERANGKCMPTAYGEMLRRWSGLFVVFLVYFILIPLYDGDWHTGIKKLASLAFAILAWWIGYSQLGMEAKKFRNLLLFSYSPFIALGVVEFCSQAPFFSLLQDAINATRDVVLTYNIDRDRLHLQFSEPSFLATYLLLFLYLIQYERSKKRKFFYHVWLILAMLLSRSLTVFFVVGAALFLIAWRSRRSFIRKLLIVSIGIAVLLVGGHALLQRVFSAIALTDMSAYIRFHNTLFAWKMGASNFFLGVGFVDFGKMFSSYLAEIDLRGSEELLRILYGAVHPEPYGILAQVFAYVGTLGLVAFLFALLKGVSFKRSFPFLVGSMMATMTALPWGLPYLWMLMGMLAREGKINAAMSVVDYESASCDTGMVA